MLDFKGVERFSANPTGRDLVVGDLHGMHTLLMRELQRIGFDPDRDRLFCVGDLIDRGAESLECLSLLDEPWFHSVLGNHDFSAFLSQAAAGVIPLTEIEAARLIVPSEPWLRDADARVKEWIAHQITKMPFVIDIETKEGVVGITHASVSINNTYFDDWNDFINEVNFKIDNDGIRGFYSTLWNRDIIDHRGTYKSPLIPLEIQGVRHVIHGHVVTFFNDFQPYRAGDHVFLDGGVFLLEHSSKTDDPEPRLNIVDVTSPERTL